MFLRVHCNHVRCRPGGAASSSDEEGGNDVLAAAAPADAGTPSDSEETERPDSDANDGFPTAAAPDGAAAAALLGGDAPSQHQHGGAAAAAEAGEGGEEGGESEEGGGAGPPAARGPTIDRGVVLRPSRSAKRRRKRDKLEATRAKEQGVILPMFVWRLFDLLCAGAE